MSVRATVQPPKLADLGSDLLQVSRRRVAWSLLLPFAACTAYWILAASGWWLPAVVSLMVLSFSSYGSTSHDLVHGTLGLNRRVNDCLLFLIEAICLRSGHAYKLAHLHHHARFPHHDDVEAKAARMSFAGALLEGIVFQFRIYFWALKHPRGQRTWIITEGLVVAGLILTALAALPWTILPAVYAGLMIAGSWIIPLITSYLTHRPEAADQWQQTRVFRGWFFRLIAFDHLYHLEHHLYPAVPHHNWPELAKRLDPVFSAAGVKPVRILSRRRKTELVPLNPSHNHPPANHSSSTPHHSCPPSLPGRLSTPPRRLDCQSIRAGSRKNSPNEFGTT